METNSIEEIEARIEDALKRAKEVIDKKLIPARNLINEVKECTKRGTDTIPTSMLYDWSLTIPVMCSEIVAEKEAFALTKDLWDIETKQLQAKNLLELNELKSKIEQINKVAGTENAKKGALAEYIRNMLNGTQEALWCLGNAIGKIINARTAIGEASK